ncbi:hypothetical protein ACFT5B_15110 [Luteimicrobium sp. NPDC057192]|uniref:hypothetical protein n=1 Tax=Luteimicrobium sp. NPDC057192 TaxID=3346042 RepID=UPI00363246F9
MTREQPRWERRLIGRASTVEQAWWRFLLDQLVVASILWGAFGTGAATWWKVAAVVVVVLGEISYVWSLVNAYRYRR